MKNLEEWERLKVDMHHYLNEPSVVSEELCFYMIESVGGISSHLDGKGIMQCSEAEDSNDVGELIYMTFVYIGSDYYYVGVFPSCEECDLSYLLDTVHSLKS